MAKRTQPTLPRSKKMRRIQVWIPDTRSRRFALEAHRQSLAVARSRQANADQDFIDLVQSGSTK